jgi:hypothetical protein
MSTLLERVQRLLALAASPNENEARNAAILAARLIREHRIVLSLPARPTPAGTPRRRTPGSRRAARKVADAPERIVSPLGGDCRQCGARYGRGEEILWFSSGGGMHATCFDAWAKKQ